MFRFLVPALVMVPLLNGVPTKPVTAATNDSMGVRESHAPIVKVEEGCSNGYFRNERGHCLPWYGGEPAHRPHEGCPPDRHFVHWMNHEGGFCQLNY
jgi:hypothetical protein